MIERVTCQSVTGGAGVDLSPLRPREFFARPWVGGGELVPRLGGRRRARRFRFRSECEFRSDVEWIVRDTTEFEDGETSTRTMRAELVAADRIVTSADDMPGGTELQLEERGWRFRPYVLKIPVGPLRIRVRCRDRCWLDDRGVLHDEIEVRFMGARIARITMELSCGNAAGN
jgi:hypothetical protein